MVFVGRAVTMDLHAPINTLHERRQTTAALAGAMSLEGADDPTLSSMFMDSFLAMGQDRLVRLPMLRIASHQSSCPVCLAGLTRSAVSLVFCTWIGTSPPKP